MVSKPTMPAARRRSKPRADHPRVYLDASALNRPFDDQRLSRNRLEAEAVLVILESVETGQIKLVGSAALVYENLTRSEQRDGFTFDLAGHWLHLTNPYTKSLFEEVLAPEARWVERVAVVFRKLFSS